jgi:DNA-binding response OmpR family regulator
LIVEDDRVTALVLSEYLISHGYRTTVAQNGVEGIEQFVQEEPDLALVDVLLPRKNGFETCSEMKKTRHGRATPVVLMSAYFRTNEQIQEYAPGVHAEAFLVKPFDLDLLLGRVHDLLGEP